MKDIEDDDKSIAKNDEEKLEVNNTSMEFKYNYEQYEGNYEAWLTNELLAMDVDGDTRELIQRKTTFLNISSEAYYGGGTWFVDRWYNPPVNCAGRGENNVYSETDIQCAQKNTVCLFPNEKFKENTRGDDDSNINIRKRRWRGPSSSSWCSGRLWKTEDHQRRHLTGGGGCKCRR